MRKKITKLWCVGLVVAVLASLLVAAAPVSAKPLAFTNETLPSGTNEVLEACDILDIAVAGDGETIYAVGGGLIVYKSTNSGIGWTTISTGAGGEVDYGIDADLVAVAPDDADYVVIAATDNTVYVTSNGGVSWGELGMPEDTGATGAACTTIYDIDISAGYAGNHYVAVAGQEAGDAGNIWYYKLGIGGSWEEANTKDGFHTAYTSAVSANICLAVQFSPNFSSDQVLTAVTTTDDTPDDTFFEMFSVNLEEWNDTAGFDNFPVTILDDTDNISATAASIALAPTYLGGDEVERIAFVGVTTAAGTHAGVFRLEDYTDKEIKTGENIHSVAYDGANIVAGSADDTTVWRCSEPLETSPTFYVSSTTKSPGGTGNVVVKWAGTDVVAGTTGDESAFAVSRDNGKAFNDISLIDTTIVVIEDLAVAGSAFYFVSDNGDNLSVWRTKGQTWERVLSIADSTGYIVRTSPASEDVIYVVKPTAKTLYYSSAGGDTKWYSRSSRYAIQDLAVESDDTAYIGVYGSNTVSKTVNGGFTWDPAEDTELVGGDIHSITCIGEDQVIVASDNGYCSYSTDGNATWNRILQPIYPGAPASKTLVAASGLETGNFIYGVSQADTEVRRWAIGQSQTTPWKDLEEPSAWGTDGYDAYGIALANGVLYVSGFSATTNTSVVLRTLSPEMAEPSAAKWSVIGDGAGEFSPPADLQVPLATTPSNLVVSSTPAFNKLWAVSINNHANDAVLDDDADAIPTYMDMLAFSGPELSGPTDGTQIKINPISGAVYDVSFSWKRISEATQYNVRIALDPEFTEIATTATSDSTEESNIAVIIGPNGDGNTVVTGDVLTYNPGTTYYWKTRVDDEGPIFSPWSEVRSFTIEAGSAVVPVIGSPINGGTVTGTPAFSWSPVSGADMYEFQLSADTTFGSPIASAKLAQTGIQPDAAFEPGTTYFWRVRSLEPIEGGWSTIANFTIAVPAVEKPPVVIQQTPPPEIIIETPPAQEIVIPPAPEPVQPISQGLLWAVIIIGAVLVIAVIVLILRTRRTV